MGKSIVRAWLVLGGMALAACSDTPVLEPVADRVAAVVPGPVVASANGSGHFTSGGELRSFTLAAEGREDGSVTGEFHITIHAINRHFHATVTCLSVEGNKAWVGGIIDSTDHPAIIPGTVSYFWVVDGGEGPDAVDIASLARINDAAGEDRRFCSLKPDEAFSGLPGRVVEKGNVQVSSR